MRFNSPNHHPHHHQSQQILLQYPEYQHDLLQMKPINKYNQKYVNLKSFTKKPVIVTEEQTFIGYNNILPQAHDISKPTLMVRPAISSFPFNAP